MPGWATAAPITVVGENRNTFRDGRSINNGRAFNRSL
jgi:hypothetical protein